ncbi:acyl-CoA-binding domain-containing protein 4-like isoform X1 [Senna tora]|uniref:Acyl-CoA-binding domain-containing protein 4-like isoform X1 n=1 Tax=Senna tora TaxID=362788 RepID=A0A834T945_9FABA|nr:acyl-CoA-binding domain-containing protein 4-like isoform X1 [Senna tora]
MGSLGAETAKKKAMWLYPQVLGFQLSERWGHSACFFQGLMYVFGGCCGGLHFSDVLTLDLEKMGWRQLGTTGEGPGPRDSHSAVIVGHKMIVFGGTNGFKKVNDIHVLNLITKEWVRPECKGNPPSPRESHTATLLGNERLVIFGGSGEGDANYLNDLHILDLGTMRWSSPEVKGDLPVPRDSHTTLAIGNKLFVYGGDCGDQYHGNLTVEGSSWPGVRAGHAAVNIGTKASTSVYIIGGVGDKRYYNDVWVFDICTCSWTQLEIRGQKPQGRFSHTAVVADMDIVIYGGCGENERPLDELLVLQLGAEHPNGRYNISMCKVFGSYCNQENRAFPIGGGAETNLKTRVMGSNLEVLDTSQQKRRRMGGWTKTWDVESEQEEHSVSLSQHSSPTQSDQEHTPAQKPNEAASVVSDSQPFLLFNHELNQMPTNSQHDKSPRDLHFLELEKRKQQQYVHHHVYDAERKPMDRPPIHHLIGAEVRGKVDGAFDSGLLMTASVNGKIFRGVLFAPGAGVVWRPGEANCSCIYPWKQGRMESNNNNNNKREKLRVCQQLTSCSGGESCQVTHPFPIMRGTPSSSLSREQKMRSHHDLNALSLTLGGPAHHHAPS